MGKSSAIVGKILMILIFVAFYERRKWKQCLRDVSVTVQVYTKTTIEKMSGAMVISWTGKLLYHISGQLEDTVSDASFKNWW